MPHMREDHETREMILDDIWTMLVMAIATSAWYWSRADRTPLYQSTAYQNFKRASKAHQQAAMALSRALGINNFGISEYIESLGMCISSEWRDCTISDIIPQVVKDMLVGDEVGYPDPTAPASHTKTFTV